MSSGVVVFCKQQVLLQYFNSNSSNGTFAFVPLQCDLVPHSSVVLPVGSQDQST